MNLIWDWLGAFWAIQAEMAPWLLLGLFVAGGLGYFVKGSWWTKHLGEQNFWSHLKAVLIGIPLPLCSCSVIPTGIGLYRRGASRSASLGFLTATPQTGVDSVMLTGGVLGWPLAIVKVLAALAMGLCTATLIGLQKELPRPATEAMTPEDEQRSLKNWWFQSTVELPAALAKPYLLGLLVSVILTQVLPPQSLALMAGSPLLEMSLALLISLPMYVCATSSIPFALLFLQQGLGYGAILVFLMAGPASNTATMLVIAKEFGWRSFAVYFGVLVLGCFAIGYGMELFLPRPNITLVLDAHEHLGWWSHLAGVLLMALFLPQVWPKKLSFFKAKSNRTHNTEQWQLSGLTCQGCVKKLRAHFAENGIQVVTMNTGECELQQGHAQNISQLSATLGFKATQTVASSTHATCCGSKGSCH
jgi:uncharacterized protein